MVWLLLVTMGCVMMMLLLSRLLDWLINLLLWLRSLNMDCRGFDRSMLNLFHNLLWLALNRLLSNRL